MIFNLFYKIGNISDNILIMRVLINKLRRERNMSLRQLEEATGLGKSTLNNYENGVSSPTIDALEMIAIALHCRITDLLDSPYL